MSPVDCKVPMPLIQLQLFPEPSPPVSNSIPDSFPILDRLAEEERHKRRSFTSRDEYMKSPEWQAKRNEKFLQVGRRCERCGRTKNLDVHHKHYNSLYDERMENLEVVCRTTCHNPADRERERSSALSSYLRTRFGDAVCAVEPSDYVEDFDGWWSNKRNEW